MSGMYTMLPLTQVLRERKEGDWKREGKEGERQGQHCMFLVKTGAGEIGEDG